MLDAYLLWNYLVIMLVAIDSRMITISAVHDDKTAEAFSVIWALIHVWYMRKAWRLYYAKGPPRPRAPALPPRPTPPTPAHPLCFG